MFYCGLWISRSLIEAGLSLEQDPCGPLLPTGNSPFPQVPAAACAVARLLLAPARPAEPSLHLLPGGAAQHLDSSIRSSSDGARPGTHRLPLSLPVDEQERSPVFTARDLESVHRLRSGTADNLSICLVLQGPSSLGSVGNHKRRLPLCPSAGSCCRCGATVPAPLSGPPALSPSPASPRPGWW